LGRTFCPLGSCFLVRQQHHARFYTIITIIVTIGIITSLVPLPLWQEFAANVRGVQAAPIDALHGPLGKKSDTESQDNLSLLSQLTGAPALAQKGEDFLWANPYALASFDQQQANDLTVPLTLFRQQSTHVATGLISNTVSITFTVTNNMPFAAGPDIPDDISSDALLDVLQSFDPTSDAHTIRNVLLVVNVIPEHATLLDVSKEPDRSGNALAWNLGDIVPGKHATLSLQLQVDVEALDFTTLDNGAEVWGTLTGRRVSATIDSTRIASGMFADWLQWTVDADYYDRYLAAKIAELDHDPVRMVRCFGFTLSDLSIIN
jgi:hypothetical protein